MNPAAVRHLQVAHDYCASVVDDKEKDAEVAYAFALETLDAATEHLEEAAEIDPDATVTIENPKAKESVTFTLDELRAKALFLEGHAHAYFGETKPEVEKGRVALEKAILHNPLSATSHAVLGYALLRLDREEDAVEALERALELNPRDKKSQRILDGFDRPSVAADPPAPAPPFYFRPVPILIVIGIVCFIISMVLAEARQFEIMGGFLVVSLSCFGIVILIKWLVI